MDTAPTLAAATDADANPFRRRAAWAAVLLTMYVTGVNGLTLGKTDNVGSGVTIIAGLLLVFGACQNWRVLWNRFGRFLRTSLGDKTARIAFGLIGGAFAIGGILGTLAR